MNPLIIAEVGSNFHNIEDCLNSIRAAKACGAHAVKFQTFTYEDMYGIHRGHAPGYQEWKDMDIVHWLPALWEECQKNSIELMCTAFSPESYLEIDPFVRRHKIAGAECTHTRILETVRKLKKPILVSIGGHTMGDAQYVKSMLSEVPFQHGTNCDFTLMYCVSGYPARYINFENINSLKAISPQVGYSDHSVDVLNIPYMAVHNYGACVLEKHFRLDHVKGTPDAPHSLNPFEFRMMVKRIMRQDVMPMSPEEQGMVLRHNRRLIAVKDIAEGETMLEGYNFGIYRSLMVDSAAYPPAMVMAVNGKKAKKDIKKLQGIGPKDV